MVLLALLVVVASCSAEPKASPGESASTRPAPTEAHSRSAAPRVPGLGEGRTAEAEVEPLPVAAGWGPSEDEITHAGELVAGLSLRERAGQVIIARYAGTAAPTRMVNRLHLGGVIVFDENIAGNDQIRRSNRRLQASARKAGRPFPVTISVDQEGGLVERVTTGTRFPAFMTAGAADRPRLTRRAWAASGAELAGLGFTMDFAPIADVTIGPADPTIGSRSAGSRPRLVATHAIEAARGLRSVGVVPVLKHFPGHGSVTADSHLTLPVQRRSVARLADRDFVPFAAGVDAGLPSVMVGHIDLRAVDPGVSSSLSAKVITGLLRERLGFDGLVFTDAMNMRAITERYRPGQAAVRALRAGADVVLMPPSPRLARDAIVRAVRDGRLAPRRLEEAATRHVALLLHQQAQQATRRPPGSARLVARRWSAAAITSVAGPCRGRLVGDRVHVTGPAPAVRTFRAAADAAGLSAGRQGTTVRLIGSGGGPAVGDVVVALGTPYPLGRSRAEVKLATYGDTPGAMSALVDVLLGQAGAPGKLPVPVAGVPRAGCS
jgi:beta-N-acetylhexosaminidase